MGRYAYCFVATNGDTAYGHKTTNGKSPTVMGQPTAGRLHFTLGGFQRHIHLFLGRLRLSFFRGSAWRGGWWQSVSGGAGCRPAPLVAFGGGGFCRRASWRFTVCPFRLVFCLFSARFPFRRVFVRPSCFRAFLPRFRACFGRLRVCRAVIRCALSILTPFFARLRRFFARLVYLFKAIKKPVLGAIFKAFRGRSVLAGMRSAWIG